jgi:hypothetical protein
MRAAIRTHDGSPGDAGASIETAERTGHGRLAADPARGDFRGYVAAFVVSALGLVLAVGGLNALVDPYGFTGARLLPTAIESDRSAKITLIEQLRRAPGILILGSSRSRTAAPRDLQRLTGESGFNAGVTGGDSVDELVFARMLNQRFPDVTHRYLVFVNVGLGGAGVNPQLASDPRARPFLSPRQRSRAGVSLLTEVSDYLSIQATRDSLRVLRACVLRSCTQRWFNPDGSLLAARAGAAPDAKLPLHVAVARKVAEIRRRPLSTAEPGLANRVAFIRLIRWMNAHGATPVVVMNPLAPALLRELDRRGFPQHRWAVRYLHGLESRVRFDFIDLTDVRTFHGLRNGFADPTHVSVANMRLMLRYIVAHDHGIL